MLALHFAPLRAWPLVLIAVFGAHLAVQFQSGVPTGMLLNVGFKNLFQRARPLHDDPLVQQANNSFPSGHAVASTVFYGALSVHLGTYLLLRVSPLLDVSPALRIEVVLLGLASAIFGAVTALSARAFATLSAGSSCSGARSPMIAGPCRFWRFIRPK